MHRGFHKFPCRPFVCLLTSDMLAFRYLKCMKDNDSNHASCKDATVRGPGRLP